MVLEVKHGQKVGTLERYMHSQGPLLKGMPAQQDHKLCTLQRCVTPGN